MRVSKFNASHFIVFCLAFISSGWAFAQTTVPGIPQIPAFLPLSHTVTATSEAMPLDGVWNITSNNKRIRIERGRAYAVDGWLHLFVLKVQPNMVVIKDIVKTGAGQYSGVDLPLMGTAVMQASPSGTLNVTVQTFLGPIKYVLAPVQLDDRDWFEKDRNGEGRDREDDDQYDDSGDDTEQEYEEDDEGGDSDYP